MTGIIDYGMGNVGSLSNMIERLGEPSLIISEPGMINSVNKLVLPGVGAFDNGMKNLKQKGFVEPLTKKVLEEKIPVLCICLGMQLITKKSEEGDLPGLAWIDAECKRFRFDDPSAKIPHMGWNSITYHKKSGLTTFIPDNPRFYFVHSYYVQCNDASAILASTEYHLNFTSAIEKDNIFATQFHPEKSHKYGMGLIRSFIELC